MTYPKRYSPFYTLRNGDTGLASFGVEPRDDGIYVEHSDYWKLFEEVTRLKAEVEAMRTVVERLERVELSVRVIRDIIVDHFGRHYYYKLDYAMNGKTL